MSKTRFFLTMPDPENLSKQVVIHGNPMVDGELEDDAEFGDSKLKPCDGTIELASSDEDWGECGGMQKVVLNGKKVKLGMDIASIGEPTKKRVAYASDRGKELEDAVIALATIISNMRVVGDASLVDHDASAIISSIQGLQ